MAGIWAAAGLGVLTAVLLVGSAGSGSVERPALLVTVGDVTDQRAVIWARAPGAGPLTVDLGPAGGDLPRRLSGEATAASDFTVKLAADGLEPATRHGYRVMWRGVVARGEFVTAPAPATPGPVRLLWSGDLGGGGRCRESGHGYRIFAAMIARRPDLFVFAGDTIYADQRCPVPENLPGADFRATTLRGFRAKHRYNRADPAVQAFFRGTAVYAIWDDHEVRNDFAGPSEPLMPDGRQAFLEYWPILPPVEDPARLYRRVRWGRLVEVFILDTRQYRSANVLPDGPEKTMLGAVQRDWLLAGLTASDAVWKVVVSSVSLSIPTGRDARDGWANGDARVNRSGLSTGFERELLSIVKRLAERRVRNLVWLVADVHRPEVIRHDPIRGFSFHELVAGPLSAGTGAPGVLDDTLRPTRLFGEGGYYSVGELDVSETGLAVRILDAGGAVRYETTLRPQG